MRVIKVNMAGTPTPFLDWGIKADYYSPALNAHARTVPGMIWNPQLKAHVGSIDAVEYLCSRLAHAGLRYDDSALKGAHRVGEPVVPIAEKGIRPYQLEAVRFLIARKRALLGDVMGLGKSCSALIAARALNSRTLIVCPSYVRGVWAAPGGEIDKWWPASRAAGLFEPKGTKPTVIFHQGAQIIVIHYDILHAWVDALREWGPRVVIPDEAHALMSGGSRRTIAFKAIADHAECVWGLTGTPPCDKPKDLWAVVDAISPGRFGPFFNYALRYCNAHKVTVGGGAM